MWKDEHVTTFQHGRVREFWKWKDVRNGYRVKFSIQQKDLDVSSDPL